MTELLTLIFLFALPFPFPTWTVQTSPQAAKTDPLLGEAKRHVETAFSDIWLKRGEFLFSKQSDGERVFEISDFSITVEEGKKTVTRADQLNGVEWRGQVRVHWSAERTWYKGFGWTEWTEGETVEFDLVRKKGVWKTISGNRLADSIRPEAAEHRPLVKPTPAEIIEIEDDPTMSEEALLKIQGESGTPATPRPTILSQPTPKTTEEARQNKIEGNVVLSVEFRADGTIGDIRIIRSLGYGLDENAVSAARQIRFRPAMSNGKPMTTQKSIEFKFRLM